MTTYYELLEYDGLCYTTKGRFHSPQEAHAASGEMSRYMITRNQIDNGVRVRGENYAVFESDYEDVFDHGIWCGIKKLMEDV